MSYQPEKCFWKRFWQGQLRIWFSGAALFYEL